MQRHDTILTAHATTCSPFFWSFHSLWPKGVSRDISQRTWLSSPIYSPQIVFSRIIICPHIHHPSERFWALAYLRKVISPEGSEPSRIRVHCYYYRDWTWSFKRLLYAPLIVRQLPSSPARLKKRFEYSRSGGVKIRRINLIAHYSKCLSTRILARSRG